MVLSISSKFYFLSLLLKVLGIAHRNFIELNKCNPSDLCTLAYSGGSSCTYGGGFAWNLRSSWWLSEMFEVLYSWFPLFTLAENTGCYNPNTAAENETWKADNSPPLPSTHMHTNIFNEVMPGNSIFLSLDNEFQPWGLLMIATGFCIWGGGWNNIEDPEEKKSLHVKTDRRKRGMNLHKMCATGPIVKV